MSVDFLLDYIAPVILGICLCVGYILKNAVKTDKINGYIPLIMGLLGLALSIWANGEITPVTILIGLISGLASTGAYELFKNLIRKKDDNE